MINTIEQITRFVDCVDDYYFVGKERYIGYGRNINKNPFTFRELALLKRVDFEKQPLSEEEATMLLVNDVSRIEEAIKDFLPWNMLNFPRRAACVNIALMIGVKNLLRVEQELGALAAGFYEKFARFLLKVELPEYQEARLIVIVEQIATGEWC